jgi:hypothetical protein
MSSIHSQSFKYHHFITPLCTLQITNRKQRSLTPYSTNKSLYVGHRFASWFGTMASSRSPNSGVHRTRVKQRESRVKPEVATVSLARGVFGGKWRARIDRTNSPRRWRRAQSYIDITHALELVHTTLSISSSTVSLWDLFVLPNYNPYACISFFLAVQCLIILFLFTNLYYLHQNLKAIILPLFFKVNCTNKICFNSSSHYTRIYFINHMLYILFKIYNWRCLLSYIRSQ